MDMAFTVGCFSCDIFCANIDLVTDVAKRLDCLVVTSGVTEKFELTDPCWKTLATFIARGGVVVMESADGEKDLALMKRNTHHMQSAAVVNDKDWTGMLLKTIDELLTASRYCDRLGE